MRIFVLSVITLSIFDKETQLIPNPSLISHFQWSLLLSSAYFWQKISNIKYFWPVLTDLFSEKRSSVAYFFKKWTVNCLLLLKIWPFYKMLLITETECIRWIQNYWGHLFVWQYAHNFILTSSILGVPWKESGCCINPRQIIFSRVKP